MILLLKQIRYAGATFRKFFVEATKSFCSCVEYRPKKFAILNRNEYHQENNCLTSNEWDASTINRKNILHNEIIFLKPQILFKMYFIDMEGADGRKQTYKDIFPEVSVWNISFTSGELFVAHRFNDKKRTGV